MNSFQREHFYGGTSILIVNPSSFPSRNRTVLLRLAEIGHGFLIRPVFDVYAQEKKLKETLSKLN